MRLYPYAIGSSCVLLGCSWVLSYPEAVPEQTPSTCSDGTDNDFDGKIDCDDPKCDGTCEESSDKTCKDGRDNDGDGLTDSRDPRCFPLLSPELQRCASAEPVTLLESFDGPLAAQRWYAVGALSSLEAQTKATSRVSRTDKTLQLAGMPGSGGIVSRTIYDLATTSAHMSFAAKVPSEWTLTAALVPASLAPENQPILSSALTNTAVTLNACQDRPRAILSVPGQTAAPPFSVNQWTTIDVTGADRSLVLKIDGKTAASLPLNTALAPSRIAILVAACEAGPNPSGQVEVDDFRVSLGGTMPCGFPSPQIPTLSVCRDRIEQSGNMSIGVLEPSGLSVSLAQRMDQKCAVVERLSTGSIQLESWISTQSHRWTKAGLILASVDLTGGSIGWNEQTKQWVATATELDASEQVVVTIHDSPDCAQWTKRGTKLLLPAMAESPSLLVPGLREQEELYFTTSPSMKTGRSLWRTTLSDAASRELVTEFGSSLPIDPPVILTRMGKSDIVAAYTVSPVTGQTGIGMLVAADKELRAWTSAHPQKPTLLEYRQNQAGFDRDGILSGAFAHNDTETFLFYAGRGEPLYGSRTSQSLSPTTVGTAKLIAFGESLASSIDEPSLGLMRQPELCGNAVCEQEETCSFCPIDCGPCEGQSVVTDTFETAGSWQWTSTANAERLGGPYWNEPFRKLAAGAIDTSSTKENGVAWLSRSLAAPLAGDFELSFDFAMAPDATQSQQPLYVGLADSPMPSEAALVALNRSSTYVSIHAASRSALALQLSSSEGRVLVDVTSRVVLSRRASRLTVSTLGLDRCTTSSVELTDSGSSSYSQIVIGYDARWTSLSNSTGNAFVDNLMLRIPASP